MVTTVGIKGKKPKDGIYALKQLVLESAPPEFLPFREDVLGYIRSVGNESEASDVWISKLAPRLLGDDEPVPDLAAVHRASAKRSGTAKGSNADLNAADGSGVASVTPDGRSALSGDAPVPEGNSWDIENALGAAIHSFMAAGAAKALGNTTSSHASPATQGTPFGAPGVRSMQSQVLGNITENQRRASFEKLLESLNNSGDDEKDSSGPPQKAKPATGMDGGKDALPGGLGAALTHAATTGADNTTVLASGAIKLPVPPRVNPGSAAVAVGSIAGAGLGSTAVAVDPSQLADPAAALSRSHAQPERQALEKGRERSRSVRAKSKESSQPGTPFSRKDEVIDSGSPVAGEHLAEVDTDLLGGDAAGKRGLRKLNARRIVDRKLVWPLNCWVCREPMDRVHPYVVCNSTCKRAYHASCEAIAALKLRLQIKPIDVETPGMPRGRSARGAARGRGRSSVRASSRKGNVGAPDSLSPDRVPGSADANYTAGMEGSSLQEAYASGGRNASTDSAPRLRASGSGSAASRAGSVSEHATGLSGRDASLRGIGAVDGTRNRHATKDNDQNELEVSAEWRKLVPSSTGWTRVTPNCISRECSFCINSYAGCSACFKFVAIKDLCRCAMDGCSTFYCYPACLRQVRLVVPDVQIMEIHQLVYGNVDRLLDENKRPIFICHGHTCWSCYDCDRYSYLWETLWRIEANRSETDYMNTAWQDLRKTCRGKVETAHFAKGKKLTRPLVYPDLRLYKTYMQSRRFAIHGVSGSTASKTLYPPSDDEDRATFHQVTSNVLMRCVRCERTWCTHCLHPDVRILQNSGKQMICQDCIHVEMVQALSQDRVERSSQHELIDPKVMVPSRHPLDVYNTVSSYIASQGLYQSKLAVKPHFLDPGSFYHVPDAAELAATCPRKIRSDAGKTRARGAAASKAGNADGADKVNDCKREAIDVVPRAKADGASASGGKRGAQSGPKGEKSSANATGSAPGVKGASGTKTNVDANAATTPKNLVKTEGSSSASLGDAGATRVTSGGVDGGAVNQPAKAEKVNGSELIRQGDMAAAVNTVSTGLNLSNAMGQPPVMPGGLPNPAAQVTAAMSPTNASQAGAGGAQAVVGEFGASAEIPVGSAEALDGQQLPAQGEKRRRGRPRNSTEKSPSSARQAKTPQEGGDTPVQEGEEVQRRKYVRRAKTEKGLKPAKTTKASKSGRSEMSSDDEGDARPKRATRPAAVRHPLIASSRRELRAQVRTRLNRMHSKEFNVMVREVDPLVVLRLCSEFRYMTSNLITDDSLRSISGVQASTKCSCTYGCSSTCANIARHVECNNVNCNLGDINCGNRRFKHMGIPKLRLRMVEGKGMGAFAAEDIDEDELVCEYVGRVITQAQFQRCVSSWSFAELDNANQSHWYIMKVHKDVYIDSTNMGNVARFINHSCEPNCSSVPFYVNGTFRMGVFAQRRIAKGEEVTYNYGFSSRGVGGGFKCLCGAKNCRGIVGVQPDTTAETLQEIEIAKASGLEYDTLSQLMYDIASMHGCNSDVSSMKNSPSPIDILNGIRTTGDLYRYEKSQTRLRLKGENDLGSGLVMPISPVTLVVEDSMQLNHSQLNYAKLLVLGGRTMKEWDMANTKEFAAGIPWGIIALENNKATMTKSLESGCAFPDFYSRAKRYIQTMCMALSRQCAGNQGCENVQSLMDLTWGATEPCYVCNGYGDCKNCDHCGDVLHDDNACGDFYVNRAGMNLCNVCQNSDHRLAWLLSSDIAKESMAMRLWRLRMEMAYRQSRATFRSLVAQHKASANEGAETGGSQSRVYLRPEAMLCTRRELERFNKSPTAFYDMQVKYHTQCQNALSNYECFW